MTIGSPEWKKSNSQTFDRVAEADDPHDQEERHHSCHEVSVCDLPRAAMVSGVALLLLHYADVSCFLCQSDFP
jgi:hypothetical protein